MKQQVHNIFSTTKKTEFFACISRLKLNWNMRRSAVPTRTWSSCVNTWVHSGRWISSDTSLSCRATPSPEAPDSHRITANCRTRWLSCSTVTTATKLRMTLSVSHTCILIIPDGWLIKNPENADGASSPTCYSAFFQIRKKNGPSRSSCFLVTRSRPWSSRVQSRIPWLRSQTLTKRDFRAKQWRYLGSRNISLPYTVLVLENDAYLVLTTNRQLTSGWRW